MSFLKSLITPAGVMLPYGGSTAPGGWLVCNGAAVSRVTYAKLFAAIGVAHGAGDGSTTFTLPDTRGRFLRGVDGGAARDPDRGSRSAAATGGNTGDAVGSTQLNATAANGLSTVAVGSHNHGGATGNNSGSSIWNDIGSFAYGQTGATGAPMDIRAHTHPINSDGAHSHSMSGDNETRPVNVNVNYIIKI